MICHWLNANSSKSECKTCKWRDSNPSHVSLLGHKCYFSLLRRLIFQCSMRTLLIIEHDVRINPLFKLFFGRIILSIQFLFFKWCKKWFGNYTIMRSSWIWEWLDRPMLIEQPPKTMRGVLRTMIAVKNKFWVQLACFTGDFERRCAELWLSVSEVVGPDAPQILFFSPQQKKEL